MFLKIYKTKPYGEYKLSYSLLIPTLMFFRICLVFSKAHPNKSEENTMGKLQKTESHRYLHKINVIIYKNV